MLTTSLVLNNRAQILKLEPNSLYMHKTYIGITSM